MKARMKESGDTPASLTLASHALLVKGNLKRQKAANALVGLAIAVASILFMAAAAILGSLDGSFGRMFERAKASHLLLGIDTRLYSENDVIEWWKTRPDTVSVAAYDVVRSGSKPYFRGKELASMVYYAEFRPGLVQDLLVPVAESAGNDQGAGPGHGEVWIPLSLARQEGIATGDILSLPIDGEAVDFSVGAIVMDPHFSSGYINPARLWLASGELPLHYPPDSLVEVELGIRLRDPEKATAAKDGFAAWLGGGFNGSAYTYEDFRFALTWLLRLIGSAMTAFSLIAVATCCFLLAGAVDGSVRAEYAQIGLCKSFGFTPSGITMTYALQYAFIAAIVLPPAALAGHALGQGMTANLLVALGAGADTQAPSPLAIAGIAGFFALAVATAALAGIKAGRLGAMEAIRIGASRGAVSGSAKIRGRFGSRLHPVPALAARNLFRGKRRSGVVFVAAFLCAFIALVAADTVGVFGGIEDDLGAWGFSEADIPLVRGSTRFAADHDALLAAFASDADVESVVLSAELDIAVPPTAERAGCNLPGRAYVGDISHIGLSPISGANPGEGDEIALTPFTARKLGLEIGDTFGVIVFGQYLDVRLCGLYQDVANRGLGFRLSGDAILRADPAWTPRGYELRLRAGADTEAVKTRLLATWGEAVEVRNFKPLVKRSIAGMVSGVTAGFLSISLVFIALGALAAAGATGLDVRESLRDHAILKCIGYAPFEMRAAAAIKAFSVGFSGGALALAVSVLCGGALIEAGLASLGAVAVSTNIGLFHASVPVLAGLLTALSTLPASRPLATVSARIMIAE